MDLSSMLNSDSGAGRQQQSQPPAPPSKAPSSISTPHTPIQAAPPQNAFRDYGHMHASPSIASAPSPHEYPPTSAAHAGHAPAGPPGPYASPTSYHAPSGPFSSRPAPPPIHPPGALNDPRSPGSASVSGPSPYRHTPTSSLSGASAGYFSAPTQNQPPPSPQQRLQYGPPSGYPRDARDNYASQSGPVPAPVGMPTPHGSASYMQGQQPMPQTPPIGTPGAGAGPGGNAPYLQQTHQRSQSLQSTTTSTPTSAHAQHPPSYGTPSYGPQSGSPVATTHQPMHFDHNQPQRQSSQPPTPLAHGPLSTPAPRQSSVNYAQPPSPYQQRILSTPSAAYPQSATFPSQPQSQTSPPPPHPTSIPRMPSSVPYDVVSESHRRSQSLASHHSRERSLSVSPKTRIPSLPSSAGQRPPSMHGEPLDYPPHPSHQQPKQQQQQQQQHLNNSMAPMDHAQREVTPAKRKLEDRDLRPEELEPTNRRPPPPEINGNHAKHRASTSSPLVARRKKMIHRQPPVWALSGKNQHPSASSRNFVISSKNKNPGGGGLVNGNGHHKEGSIKSEHVSRHTSPEAMRGIVKQEEPPPNNSAAIPMPPARDGLNMFEGHPFALDTISFSKPFDFVNKAVADFLFFKVVANPSLSEIQQRKVQFEIEAKLGTIINRDTDHRLDWPLQGECILHDTARVAFKSSMTEAQHRHLNDFLNFQVAASSPINPQKNPKAHIPINYRRRKELDSFFELPNSMVGRLPQALQLLLNPKQPLKVRVTRDLKNGKQVIAMIVKARVADLNIWMPMYPVDCRISVNLEWEWDGSPEEIMANQLTTRDRPPDRNKDRLSYEHGKYQIDLTQVTQEVQQGMGMGKSMVKEHELEVELNADALIEHGMRLRDHRENLYAELVDTLVDDVRLMAKKLNEIDQTR